jgi:DNA-binding GntR family transcriptional regulator
MPRGRSLAYDTVRQFILGGSFLPGERLVEEDLAHRVGVSRTSIRDSLRRLAGEGLVRTEANRGTFVAEMSSEEIDEIFQLRAVLEGHATALAAVNGQPEHWDQLSQKADEIDALLGQDLDPQAFFLGFQDSNTAFHAILLQASGSKRLQALTKSLIELPLVTMKQHNWPGEVKVRRSNEQHREIISALRARDPLLARLHVQAHIIHARPKAMIERALAPVALL